MKKIVVLFLFCFGALIARGEGIEFFHGDFDAALARAKADKKMLFVDFMATWCGPCRNLAEEVFPNKALGAYFNANFICLKVDVDQSKDLASRYQIESMPTMIFMDANGKEIKRLRGFMPAERLLKKAKELNEGGVTIDGLWAIYEKDKDNLEVMQQLLQEVPYEGMGKYSDQGERVILDVYERYMKLKPREALINKADFDLISLYKTAGGSDEMMQFVCKHLADYVKVVSFEDVYDVVIPYTGGLIDNLSKAGNLEYKKVIEQAVTQQKIVFDSLKIGTWTVKEFLKNRGDGFYMLYSKKDQEAFVKLRREYFEKMGDQVDLDAYKGIISDLFEVTDGKLTVESAGQCMEWLKECLLIVGDQDTEELMGIYFTMGDLYVILGDKVKAKECYMKVDTLLTPSGDLEFRTYLQEKINSLK